MNKCIVTFAEGGHEELLDVALPTYKAFAVKHGYDLYVGKRMCDRPAAWCKIPLLIEAVKRYEEAVWFDCDLVVVDPSEDFPPMASDPASGWFTKDKLHAMVRHFENYSEVPNSGVWRLRRQCGDLNAEELLNAIYSLEGFMNHGWWEQAALMTLMGYTVPPQDSDFPKTKCKNIQHTKWFGACQFMRVAWNSHPGYRADHPHIVHCSYPDMTQRIEVMRELVKNPYFKYPRYDSPCPHCKKAQTLEPEKKEGVS